MLREITKEVGRFKVGQRPDYPAGVWTKIALDAGMKLDAFSKPVEDNPVLQSSGLKRKPVLHKRLGASQ